MVEGKKLNNNNKYLFHQMKDNLEFYWEWFNNLINKRRKDSNIKNNHNNKIVIVKYAKNTTQKHNTKLRQLQELLLIKIEYKLIK